MITKEENDTTEYFESKEENQILITQETWSEESSQDESNNQKEYDRICACSYKSINFISKNLKNPLNIFIKKNHLLFINSFYFQFG